MPGEGLSVILVVCTCSLSSRGVPGASLLVLWYSERGARGRLVCHTCSLSSGTPRGVPGEGLSVLHVVCPLVLREGCQGKAVCPSSRLSLYPHFPVHPTACIIPANHIIL